MSFGHFPNTDDSLTTLQCAGQTSEVVRRNVECFDYRPLSIGEGHELPRKADTTRETGKAAAMPSIGIARTMSRIPSSQPLWTRMPYGRRTRHRLSKTTVTPQRVWVECIGEERRRMPSRTVSAKSWPGAQPIARAGPRRAGRPWPSIVET